MNRLQQYGGNMDNAPYHNRHQQQFDWCSVRWLAEPSSDGIARINVGLFSFNPGAVYEEHVHAGFEHFIYIISGHGSHMVDDKYEELTPGSFSHIGPFTRHSMINGDSEPLQFIGVYFPLESQHVIPDRQIPPEPDATLKIGDANIWSLLDMSELGVMLSKLSQALDYRLALLDAKGNCLLDSGNTPTFCRMLHQASQGNYCKEQLCRAIRENGQAQRYSLFTCCNSVTSMLIPIINNATVVGYIKCGEIFLSQTERRAAAVIDNLHDIADACQLDLAELSLAVSSLRVDFKSVLYLAAEATGAIASYITKMAASAWRRQELDKSRLSLLQERMASSKLEKALQEADFKLLQSQVNPHFLFNALGTVAQMAYLDGSEQVADIIWSLSDLLRFTLRKTEQLVPLREEMKLLGDYTKIQQARFGKRLELEWLVEAEAEAVPIPCLLLQPVLENSIIHGLEPLSRPVRIRIRASLQGAELLCEIEDNGVGFEPESLADKNERIGLTSVRNRLKHYFGEAGSLALQSQPGQGTCVSIRLPAP